MPRNIASYHYTATLAEQDLPVLVIRAQHDRDINRRLVSTLDALKANPRAKTVDLLNAGHYANLEAPGQFNDLLNRFLEEARTF